MAVVAFFKALRKTKCRWKNLGYDAKADVQQIFQLRKQARSAHCHC